MGDIVIRSLATMAEIHEAEHLQLVTWNMTEAEIIPAHTMHALQHNGSPLLGAFDGPKMVGFVMGVLGTMADPAEAAAVARLKMYSVIAGVLPEYQKMGVGYQLKLAQRLYALRLGLALIAWTYDPLESLNGRFNIAKLGAVCNSYLPDFHGPMGGINAGLPTDRFELCWWIGSERVERCVAEKQRPLAYHTLIHSGTQLLNPASFATNGLPSPAAHVDPTPTHPSLLVEIPTSFQRLKQEQFELAQQWRLHTRAIFQTLFNQQYTVTGFVRHEAPGDPIRSFYLLTHA